MNRVNSVRGVSFPPRVISNMDSADIVMEFICHGNLSSLIYDKGPFCTVSCDVFDRLLTYTTATAEPQARRVIVNLCDALQVLLMLRSTIRTID